MKDLHVAITRCPRSGGYIGMFAPSKHRRCASIVVYPGGGDASDALPVNQILKRSEDDRPR